MANETNYINANNTYIVSFNLVDENNDPIALAVLGTLHLTNYYYNTDSGSSDRYHLATINGRFQQDVKNANDVVVSSSGAVTWTMKTADTPKLDPSTDKELHIALWQWWWSGLSNSEELEFYVRKVPYVET